MQSNAGRGAEAVSRTVFHLPASHNPHQRGIQQDAQKRSCQDRVINLVPHKIRVTRHAYQNVGELANLGQSNRNQRRRPKRIPEQAHHGEPNQKLAHNHQSKYLRQERRMRKQLPRIDQRSDGHKEQSDKGIAQRQDPSESFMRMF